MKVDTQILREAFIFIGGLAIGAVGSFVICKTHFQKKADDEIAAVERAFTAKINEAEDAKDEALDIASKAIINGNGYNREDPGSQEFLRNKSTLEGFVKTAASERVNYEGFFEKNSKETIEVDDHPRDDGEDDEGLEDGEVVSDMTKRGENGIYEISYDEYGSKSGYDFKEVYYYVGDGVVVDDEEQFIENPEFLFGDVLHTSGFDSDATRNIYVRNEGISTDFEIMKIDGSYA